MDQLLEDFLADDSGQDLIEYSLLMAFVALAAAAVFQGAGKSVTGIWITANSRLVQANRQGS